MADVDDTRDITIRVVRTAHFIGCANLKEIGANIRNTGWPMFDNDNKYMKKALSLARRAQGRTSPNPIVGAVLVKDGEVVGEGYHLRAGRPHAEINALNQAGEQARDATLYVTLEPCSHYGKTPPCVDAVIAAGVKRVVVAILDPNPRVAGQGVNRLRKAGIEVRVGVLEEEARRNNEFFFKYITWGIPFVTLKSAMTLDGKIATYTGDSRWVTGEDSRRFVHQLRNVYDAILVGIGTVIKDDPLLNTRLEVEGRRDPVRVILDEKLQLPLDSQIAASAAQQSTLVFTSNQASEERAALLEDRGIKVIAIDSDGDKLPLDVVLKALGKREIMSLLVEGGGQVNASFLEAGLVDKVYWFIAPKLCGGNRAPSPVGGRGVARMAEAVRLTSYNIDRFQEDILITGYLS
jgi:diaminohydroxyphosphoribosylaminopyrimidine deaminase/5-amino-6-(5-phosphoribosylamino)uracil reductase